MISINKIKINNFLSHGNTEIEFKDDQKLLIDGKSGSGKSSIVEALIWGLYGVARVDNRNLVKKGKKAATVTIELQEGDKTYKIERGTTDKAKNTLSVVFSTDSVNFKPIERTGLKDTQDWIENELIHASYALFINSIAYPQDNIDNFVKQSAAKRKDLLLEIANVKDFDKYYSRAKEELSLVHESIARIDGEIFTNVIALEKNLKLLEEKDSLELKAKELEDQLKRDEDQLDEIRKKQAQQEPLRQEIVRLMEEETKESKRKEELDFKIIGLRNTIQDTEKINIDSIRSSVKNLDEKIKRRDVLSKIIEEDYERTMKMNSIMADKPSIRDFEGEIGDINKRLIPLISDTSTCPAGDDCPFIVPIKNQITHLQDQIVEKTLLLAKQEKAVDAYQAKITSLGVPKVKESMREEYRILSEEIKKAESTRIQLDRAETRISSLPELRNEMVLLESKIEKIVKEMTDIEDKILGKKKTLNNLDSNYLDVESLKSLVTKQRNDLNSITSRLLLLDAMETSNIEIRNDLENKQRIILEKHKVSDALSAIRDAFGNKGLKSVASDYLIPRLEDKINEILAQLSDFRVRLDTQRSNATGEGTVEGLYINIINDLGEELDFLNYSGGEKLKITVAISEALASLQKVGFRILDELFVGLDEESTEHFAEIMNKLNGRFKQMICISHLRNIKDIFEDKIIISKVNGTSVVTK